MPCVVRMELSAEQQDMLGGRQSQHLETCRRDLLAEMRFGVQLDPARSSLSSSTSDLSLCPMMFHAVVILPVPRHGGWSERRPCCPLPILGHRTSPASPASAAHPALPRTTRARISYSHSHSFLFPLPFQFQRYIYARVSCLPSQAAQPSATLSKFSKQIIKQYSSMRVVGLALLLWCCCRK